MTKSITEQRGEAFLDTYGEALKLVGPRSPDESKDLIGARAQALLVAAAWCTLAMLRENIDDKTWCEVARVVMNAARERMEMLDGEEGTLQ